MNLLKTLLAPLLALNAHASALNVGQEAPLFELKTHDNKTFNLNSRKGQWTVLFFYPKADTPGCTKQACAFRDSLKKITDQGAEVFGISKDSVSSQSSFHKKYNLTFTLLADEDGEVIKKYGTGMPIIGKLPGLGGISKRITYIINPDLKIASADFDVDPAVDAQKVADKLKELKKAP